MKKLAIIALTILMTASLATIAMAGTVDSSKYNSHANLSANTAGCASCHTTHTANGPKLLAGSSTYAACNNCHNGTGSVYDVMLGQIGTTNAAYTSATYAYDPANAGLFIGNAAPNDAKSKHAVLDTSPSNLDLANYGGNGSFSATNRFTCAGCHDPHQKLAGSNSRILKIAPKMIDTRTDTKFTLTKNAADIVITKAGSFSGIISLSNGLNDIAPNTPKLYVQNGANWDPVTATFDYVANKFTAITLVPAYAGVSESRVFASTFWPKSTSSAQGAIAIGYGPNFRVTTPTATGPEYVAGKNTPDYPALLNQWCGTCHNDYAISTDAKVTTGDYTIGKYRHAVNIWDSGYVNTLRTGSTGTPFLPSYNGTKVASRSEVQLPLSNDAQSKIVCVTCHYAHGTKAVSMTIDNDAASGNASKLLRYDKRDTCEACHQK